MRFLTTSLLNLARGEMRIKSRIAEIPTSFFNTTLSNYEMIASEKNRVSSILKIVSIEQLSDQLLLKQLMTILFDNAVKSTEEDIEIDFLISATDRAIFIYVILIMESVFRQKIKKIFDRFYRVDKALERQKGGFGLEVSLKPKIV